MKNRLYFIPVAAIILILFLIGTFLDLSISKSIANIGNSFSSVMAVASIFPISFALATAGGLFIRLAQFKYKLRLHQIALIVLAIISFAGATYLSGRFVSFAFTNEEFSPFVLIGLASAIPGFILGLFVYRYLPSEHLLKKLIFVIVVVAFAWVAIDLIKLIAPRVRYWAILKTSEDYYRPWWQNNLSEEIIAAIKNEHGDDSCKSFPSGHSVISISFAFVLMFVPVIAENEKLYRYQWLFFMIGFIYYLIIVFSRIYGGAHYLSDTMFSGAFALSIYFIANEIYLRKLA